MSLSAFPYELAIRAAAVLGGELEASITVSQHSVTVRAGSSTGAAGRCDQVEALTGSGPCIDAMQEGSMRMVASIADGHGWEAWRGQAAREGFVSAVAVPATVDGNIAVAVNLYSRSPAPWTPERVSTAESYAQLGAAMVRLHLGRAELDDAAAGYYRHMSNAVVIERAIGAIMQANDCPEHVARYILESAWMHRGVSAREVAETILRALVVDARPSPADGAGAR
ncbi:GAF and ANTAR domain-containing protein [Promicromonospora iranensis]|jgi:hypothetical protein|uniref:GAF and ANTAR domain-containing protein n=1 Tax=Promicromonospora iranensis TaxID=1105144 RepID=UPI0023A99AF9|nr:GAF and ANTAR domain-containing protein [Promicromonospora iranensis]